jgi:RNA polymerase sigma-70 factor (ECF subfamily)
LTDQEIIDQIKNGNRDAFRGIIKKYESLVAATVYGMLGRCPEAEDVGQEVFIRFYHALEKFRGESLVSTYITRIAINLSLNELKKRKKNKFFSIHKAENESRNQYADNNFYNDEKEIVHRAIQKLDVKYRSVVILRMIDGYSTEETAKILKIPVGTVLSRLARAQHKLKDYLLPVLEGEDG